MLCTHRQYAFSLVELLVTLTVLGIVTAVGVPPMQRWTATKAVHSAALDLQRDLHHARLSAARLGRSVALCPSLNAQRCDARAALGDGWISFINSDNDAPVQRDDGEPILRTHAGTPGVRLLSNRQAFRQYPPGRRSTNGTVVVCHRDASVVPRSVIVSYTGRARFAAATNPAVCQS